MASNKRLDEFLVFTTLLRDVQRRHGSVFNTRALRLTLNKVNSRARDEGLGFLTKTLPRLGKALDKALSGDTPLNAVELRLKPLQNSNLPRFLGEFFSRVLGPDGRLLQDPCATSVAVLRQLLFCFYKYELPYSDEQTQKVIAKFERTEQDLLSVEEMLREIATDLTISFPNPRRRHETVTRTQVARRAKDLLSRLFRDFDPTDIQPCHGPGAVATKQQLWAKYEWSNVSDRITEVYPYDAYFCASVGAVCDNYRSFGSISGVSHPARVILVPKDSRGPRLISCEPVDYQWVQQGLGRAIVRFVEGHVLTKHNVHFTVQYPNRFGALIGSRSGEYATLDLNEASDRVATELVRLLFPENLFKYLEACRSLSTVLPDGRELTLRKFAPMGSALCFPIMALTIWAILTAAAPDADARESILVYGDDVIVPTAFAGTAIEQLESFGLKINRDKSCTSGLFRESCGMDAFNGVGVTPVRFRTVWSSLPTPEAYTSWIAYANQLYDRQYYATYDLIVEALHLVYGCVPGEELNVSAPSLREVPYYMGRPPKRWNKSLQKLEYRCKGVRSPSLIKELDGWTMLLRYFSEKQTSRQSGAPEEPCRTPSLDLGLEEAFSVRRYTRRSTSMLVERWW